MKILQFTSWIFLLPGFIFIKYILDTFIPTYYWHYLFYLRAPLISGLLLILFPLIARKMIPSLLRNLFVMSKGYQVAMGVFAALVAGRAIIVAVSAILENSPARFSIEPILTILFPYDYLGLAILGLPIIHGIIVETKVEQKWWLQENIANKYRQKYDREILQDKELFLNVLLGVLISIGMFIVEGIIFQLLKLLSPLFTVVVNFLSKITNGWISFTIGYIEKETNLLSSSHLSSISLFIAGCLLYWIFHEWFSPFKDRENNLNTNKYSHAWEAPVLIYISAIFSLLVTWFEGINFYFDKFNFPIFLSFILFSCLSYLIWGVDHLFELSKEENIDDMSPLPDDFQAAINQRLKYQDGHPRTLVIVTASGGGIHAAGWTAQVLTGLQELLGPEFTKSIGLISGVSGGSVGTMYFLDKCGANGYPQPENLSVIVQNAVQDGLDAVGWGLVYRDLWRFIGLPWIINQYEDRGIALEKNWQGCMDQPDITFSDWRKKAFAGEIPIPVFNTTLIEDGRRLLVSPMTFAKNDEKNRTIDSNTLYQNDGQRYDIKAVTAARLSATFPYVSPNPRNSPDIKIARNYHIADGGYFDNSGVVTAIEWLEDNADLITNTNKLNVEKLVFIEIEAQETPELQKEISGNGGWFITLFGALKALFSVRDASLILRNQQEIDLLIKHYRSKLDGVKQVPDKDSSVQYIRIDFPRRSKFRFEKPDSQGIEKGKEKGKEYTQPLSWKLTASQKYVLEEAWRGIIPEHSAPYPALVNLQRLWHEKWGFPKPEINQKGGKHRTSDN
jgi:hypothetical protein